MSNDTHDISHDSPPDSDGVIFGEHRPALLSLAYRMLGMVSEAEDIVQDTWLRWQQADQSAIETPGAWLRTVCSRLAIDRLRSAQLRRETYVGPWLPEPVPALLHDQSSSDPADQLVLAESISIGFLSILERLGPTERAVFLLREVFGVPMVEVAEIVERTEAATRQIAKRARDRVRSERPRFQPTPADAEELTEAFLGTLLTGDLDAFAALLAEDVVVVSDGGAKYRAARVPVVGRERAARFLVNLAKRHVVDVELHLLRVSGQPCCYVTADGSPVVLMVLNWLDNQVHSMTMIRNVEKLELVHRSVAASSASPDKATLSSNLTFR